MASEIWDYPTIKNLALERYEKEFVLDFAPRCFAETTDPDSFYKMMDGYYKSHLELTTRQSLRQKLIEILQLKIRLLEIESQKEADIAKQNYERVADSRDLEKEIKEKFKGFADDLNKMNYSRDNMENLNLMQQIVDEVRRMKI